MSGRRFGYLDGIRGLAILAVVIVHWGLGRTTVGRGGFLAVDVFFVLSGFVITTLLWRSTSSSEGRLARAWLSFTQARARRLGPALLGLLVGGSLLMLVPSAPVPMSETLRNAALSLAQVSWLPEMGGTVAEPFRQTWSLGIEWLFYLSWPLAVLSARQRGMAADAFARLTAAAAVLLLVPSMVLLRHEAFYFAPPARFGEILCGAALALWFVHAPPIPRPRRWSTAAAVVGLTFLAVFALAGAHPFSDLGRLLGSPGAVVVALVLIHHGYATPGGPIHRLLSSAPITLLGRCSYSLYLWHWIPVYLLDRDSVPLPAPVLAGVGLVLAALLTTASYLLLERPLISSRATSLSPGDAHRAATTRSRADAPATVTAASGH